MRIVCRLYMNQLKFCVALVALLCTVCQATTLAAEPKAEGLLPSTQTACDLAGWAIDEDPAGIKVHASPSEDSPVLGTLPPLVQNPDGYDFVADFDIVGSHNGWLLIAHGRDYPYGQPERAAYSGKGWVHGSQVTFRVQSGQGHLKPDPHSRRLVDLHDDWLTDVGSINQVLACDGKWALLDYSLETATRHTAWFRHICPIQETTCDGLAH